jgi:hypothetical protein
MLGERGRIAAALAVGALVIGACGGGGDEESEGSGEAESGGSSEVSAESIRALADESDAVQSYAFDMDVTFTGLSEVEGVPEGTPDEANVSVTGATDLAAAKTTVDLDISEIMALLPGATEGGGETVIKTVIEGQDAYVNLGALGAPYGVDATQWMKTSLDQVNQTVGGVSGSSSPSATNPASFTDLFRGVDADEDVSVEGEEEVRGEPTTHVIANANIAAAIAAAPEDQRASVEQQFGSMGVDELPLHVWLGEDGVARRIEIIAEGGQLAMLQGVGMTVIIEPYDLGKPVTVEAPAAESVVQMPGAPPAPAG